MQKTTWTEQDKYQIECQLVNLTALSWGQKSVQAEWDKMAIDKTSCLPASIEMHVSIYNELVRSSYSMSIRLAHATHHKHHAQNLVFVQAAF